MSLAELNRPLRFGVMCSANGLTDFARKCISNITRDGLAKPELLIIDETVELPNSARAKLRKSIRLDGNLWYLQQRLFPVSRIAAYEMSRSNNACPGIRADLL